MAKARRPKRSEIWLVRLDPTVGAEIRKSRPVLVVSENDVGTLPLSIVVPITDWKPDYAEVGWFVSVPASRENGLLKDSAADAYQVKSVSHLRFVRRLGLLDEESVEAVVLAVAACIGFL